MVLSSNLLGRVSFDAEDSIWIVLAIWSCSARPTLETFSTALATLGACLFKSTNSTRIHNNLWRPRAASGNTMSLVLLPMLLDALDCQFSPCIHYVSILLWALPLVYNRPKYAPLLELATASLVGYSRDGASFSLRVHDSNTISFWWICLYNIIQYTPSHHRVWTEGEWRLVTGLTASLPFLRDSFGDEHYAVVAKMGLYSCACACVIDSYLNTTSQWILRLGFVTVATLAAIELIFTSSDPLPKCLYWLADFLLDSEKTDAQLLQSKPPRYCWIGYWLFILTLFLPLSPRNASPVLARKFFHLVCILLFVPVTIHAPQLQSLAYAIALSTLIVLEAIVRPNVSTINQFYRQYLDLDKDVPDQIVVSHAALIAGCALPLWISPRFGLWGIIVLGVGDAMGALLGKRFGHHKWSRTNRRTLEGSLAMLLSSSITCFMVFQVFQIDTSMRWFPAVFATTLIEAWTSQIDNLVLPLAGLLILLITNEQ